MHKFATYVSVVFLLLSTAMLCGGLHYNLPLVMSGNRIALFVVLNSVMLVGVAAFLLMFKDRIILYLENYRREKQI